MSLSQITYGPRAGISPEAEASGLAAVYTLVLRGAGDKEEGFATGRDTDQEEPERSSAAPRARGAG